MDTHSLPSLSPCEPEACLLAAALASLGSLGALVSAWHLQAGSVWLLATPELLAEVAACERRQDRHARTQCKQALVLARAQQSQAVVLASR